MINHNDTIIYCFILLGGINEVFGIPETHAITLIWLPPADYLRDGEFSGYNITCSSSPDNETISMIMSSNSHYTATSLDPFTQYKCCIEPHWTTNGVGPTVCIEQMTLEDGRNNNYPVYAIISLQFLNSSR